MINKTLKIAIALFFISVSIVVSAFWAIRANAQNQTINDLTNSLKEKGIPVKSLIVTNRIPFTIKIELQSASNDKNLQPDDLYFAQVARKAATLLFRHGQKIDGYELEIVNSKNEIISWESNNILPREFSQQPVSNNSSLLSNSDTVNLLKSKPKLHGLFLDSIDISTDQSLGDSGQELTLQLSTIDIKTANQDLIPFLLSLHDTLDDINSGYGTRITLCWVKVYDKHNVQLLNYVWDTETREETSIQAPGIDAWYPVPAPAVTNEPTKIPVYTPMPSEPSNDGSLSYPPPGPTPTRRPYP